MPSRAPGKEHMCCRRFQPKPQGQGAITVIRTLIWPLVALQLLASCASNTGPVVRSVCVQASIEPSEALAFFNKIATSKFREYGFVLTSDGCEVAVKYTRLGGFQGEEVQYGPLGLRRGSGYWSEEGILSVSHKGQVVVEGEEVNLRGYSSKLHLLEGLASVLVKSVVRRFRPRAGDGA